MSLNSLHFIVYFGLMLTVISAMQCVGRFIGKRNVVIQLQLLILLLYSLFFIVIWDWRYCVCAVLYTSCVYLFGIVEERAKHKSIVLLIAVAGSIMMLGYFKYLNFFIESFSSLFGLNHQTLQVILPLGISFYTFSGISYLIDVHRGKYHAEYNFVYFALYMLFFGKMTAGPIVRANTFLPQVRNYRGVKWSELLAGAQIFVFGLFKKIVLADHLNIIVDDVFYAPMAYNTLTVVLAIVSYSLQIYFDFSGYSDMAIGLSKIVGFDFELNFNQPYLASNISDFWKRWHISLSSWLQDYLYIPLGGSRKGNTRTYMNLVIVMLVSGLWHGAGATFIIWGLLHGIVSCLNRLLLTGGILKIVPKWCCILVTCVFVALLWVPFRADSMETAFVVWKGVFSLHSGIFQPYSWSFFAIFCIILESTFMKWKLKTGNLQETGGYPVLDLNRFQNQVLFFTFTGLTVLMGYFGNTAFIYGKF